MVLLHHENARGVYLHEAMGDELEPQPRLAASFKHLVGEMRRD